MRFGGSRILGLGCYAPERRVDNAELEARLGKEPGWIERRTGIRARRYAADGEALTDLAVRAGEMALAASALSRADVALTLLATSTPDHPLPPSAPLLAHRLRLTGSGAIDVTGACAGFLYALALADGFVRSHGRPVLIVAANILSRRINPLDPASAILFADAAGAILLGPSKDVEDGIVGLDLCSDGAHYDLIKIPAGGSRMPFSADLPQGDLRMVMEDGRAVFSLAIEMMTASAQRALGMAKVRSGDITRMVPHQANGRIIQALHQNLDVPEARIVSTIAEFGNSSAASIPFSLAYQAGTEPLQRNEKILFMAAGAGLTGGAIVFST